MIEIVDFNQSDVKMYQIWRGYVDRFPFKYFFDQFCKLRSKVEQKFNSEFLYNAIFHIIPRMPLSPMRMPSLCITDMQNPTAQNPQISVTEFCVSNMSCRYVENSRYAGLAVYTCIQEQSTNQHVTCQIFVKLSKWIDDMKRNDKSLDSEPGQVHGALFKLAYGESYSLNSKRVLACGFSIQGRNFVPNSFLNSANSLYQDEDRAAHPIEMVHISDAVLQFWDEMAMVETNKIMKKAEDRTRIGHGTQLPRSVYCSPDPTKQPDPDALSRSQTPVKTSVRPDSEGMQLPSVIIVDSLHVSCFSGPRAPLRGYFGVVLYTVNGQSQWVLGGRRCRSGYIVVKSSDWINRQTPSGDAPHNIILREAFGISSAHKLEGDSFSFDSDTSTGTVNLKRVSVVGVTPASAQVKDASGKLCTIKIEHIVDCVQKYWATGCICQNFTLHSE
jgi:hypothetical protein